MSFFSAIWENYCSANRTSDDWLFVGILLMCPAGMYKGIFYRSGELTGAFPLCRLRLSLWAMSLPCRFVCVGVAIPVQAKPRGFLQDVPEGSKNSQSSLMCAWILFSDILGVTGRNIGKKAAREEKLNKRSQALLAELRCCCCTLWLLLGGTARKRIRMFTGWEPSSCRAGCCSWSWCTG